MSDSERIWRRGNRKEIWDRFCGFLDLTTEGFMGIQDRLLMEHVSLLARCELGRALMGERVPQSPEEFRSTVPLTEYSFYEAFLSNKREDALPVKPYDWVCTSGIGGVRKWVPVTPALYDALMDHCVSMVIVGTSSERAKFSVRHGDILFAAAPPPPYFSGFIQKNVSKKWGFRLIPPMDEEYELSDLPTRSAKGFRTAMEEGMDMIFALPGVMARVGKQFADGRRSSKGLPPPRMLLRMVRAMIRSRLAGRPILPKDVWKLKLCFVAGMDLEAFRERIVYYWGCDPYEFYAQTEFLGMPAFPTWNRKAMTPQPYISYFEFIPEGESIKSLEDSNYQPKTCLLGELNAGESYEIVFTNFYGGAFARYRPKDLINVVALEDAETGIKLPQWVFKGRADKLIDLGGFTRIDERTIWLALENAKIPYVDWMARKESSEEHPILHLYIATTEEIDAGLVGSQVHASLRRFDSSYADLVDTLGWQPLHVSLLPPGVFAEWEKERIRAGADPAFVKEQRMQPSAEAVQRILEIARG